MQVRGRLASPEWEFRAEPQVHLLKRTEETDERRPETLRDAPGLPEIPVPELVGGGDHRRSHGPVFMGPSGPDLFLLAIDPQSKTHLETF